MTKNEVRVLVMEEQKITSFDLQVQFEQKGFAIADESEVENLPSATADKTTFFLIASFSLLKQNPEYTFKKRSEYLKTINHEEYVNTDTLVLSSEMSVLKKFSKPFNAVDIVNFVNDYISAPKLQQCESA
jgi:hypothetical protein